MKLSKKENDQIDFQNILNCHSEISQAHDNLLLFLKENHPNDKDKYKKSTDDFKNGVLNFLDNKEVLVIGDKVGLRKACILDSEFIESTELLPDNSPWVGNWSLSWRIEKFGDSDFLQTVIETNAGKPVGFIIFRDMQNKSEQIELKRIAVVEKGKGYGKESLYLAQKLAFEIFKTKKLYLHTKAENIKAQEIYKYTGFTAETSDPCTSFFMLEKDYFEKSSETMDLE